MKPANDERILIVEDEQHLAEGLRFNLEAEGYRVKVVETAKPRSICCRRRRHGARQAPSI